MAATQWLAICDATASNSSAQRSKTSWARVVLIVPFVGLPPRENNCEANPFEPGYELGRSEGTFKISLVGMKVKQPT